MTDAYLYSVDLKEMELRFKVSDKFINRLLSDMSNSSTEKVTEEALKLLKWAVKEAQEGREIVSTDASGSNPKRLYMDSLEAIKARVKNKSSTDSIPTTNPSSGTTIIES